MKNLKVIIWVALSVIVLNGIFFSVIVLNGIFFSLNPSDSVSGEVSKLSVSSDVTDFKVENTENNSILVKSFDKSGKLNWEKEIVYQNENLAKNVFVDNGDINVEFTSFDLKGKEVNGVISYKSNGDLKNISIE